MSDLDDTARETDMKNAEYQEKAMSEATRFDVFLSHNSQDKPQVEQLACWLREQGLRVWYDEWELRPGLPWQERLEEGITHSGAVVVCVGPSGFGPWHEPEMRAALAKGLGFVQWRRTTHP